MTVAASDIGKLVRVGDCEIGSGVRRLTDPATALPWRVDSRRGSTSNVHLRSGSWGWDDLDSNALVTLLSLPAEADRAQHRAEQPDCPVCALGVRQRAEAAASPPPDPLRVYGPGAPVPPKEPTHIPTGTLVRVCGEAWRVASHGVGVLVLWPAVDAPKDEPTEDSARHWWHVAKEARERFAAAEQELHRVYAQRDAAEVAQAKAEAERDEARGPGSMHAHCTTENDRLRRELRDALDGRQREKDEADTTIAAAWEALGYHHDHESKSPTPLSEAILLFGGRMVDEASDAAESERDAATADLVWRWCDVAPYRVPCPTCWGPAPVGGALCADCRAADELLGSVGMR